MVQRHSSTVSHLYCVYIYVSKPHVIMFPLCAMLLMLKKEYKWLQHLYALYDTSVSQGDYLQSAHSKPVYLKTGSGPNLKSNSTATYTVTFRHHSSLVNFLIMKKM